MKEQFVIIDLHNMDYMKNKEGKIIIYDSMEEACATCGMYEFEDVWVMQLIYNHKENNHPKLEAYTNNKICPNCNEECNPIPIGLMCNKCVYDKLS